MDVMISRHLSAAASQQDAAAMMTAYKLIKAANRERSANDAPEIFSAGSYVLCAAQALELGDRTVSLDCLNMYFNSSPPPDQYYGRAFLCQAQLVAPLTAEDVDGLEKSVACFMKAIDFAKKQQRYHFLVYNASILYWKTIRPFLKPGSRHLLISSLASLVKALAETDDEDKDWRADLMLELLECFLDAQKMKEASDCAALAAEFIKANVPSKYPLLFSKMVHHKLIDSAKAVKETKSSASLSVIFKIQKLRSQMDNSMTPKEISASLGDIYTFLAQVTEDTPLQLATSDRILLLVDLARLSLESQCSQVASACINDLKKLEITNEGTLITLECLQSELTALTLGSRIETYAKSAIEVQLNLVKSLERTLEDAVRLGDPAIIQSVCTTQWNMCLPLLQQKLRRLLKRPLVSVSEALESIDSLLTQMRCQIYMEIAQIEDEEDRVEIAVGLTRKALMLNGSGKYKHYLNMYLHRLELRATLYTKPEGAEDQAAMILEQAKRGNPKDSVRKKRPLLVNVGLHLAPDGFQMVLDSENESKVSTGKGSKGRVSHLSMKAQHHSKCVSKTEGHLSRTEEKCDAERARLWADLAKVARKQEVWDVCRAACRFCLLYDDGRWNIPTCDVSPVQKSVASIAEDGKISESESPNKPAAEPFSDERLLLRILAEIRFINAEATIHLLQSEGCKMNESPLPPEDTSKRPASYVHINPEEDPDWIIYKNWISQLSDYAMDNFLRGAELGVQLQEAWITHNAAVYILNYNKHIIASGKLSLLVEPLKKVLAAVKKTGHNGNPALLVMVSNTLAKGLVLPWILALDSEKHSETSLHTEKSKKAPGKAPERSNAALSIDQNGLPDVRLALEVCEFALDLTNGRTPEDVVPISIRQQLLATWVKVKQLLQQQIGQKLGTDEEENNDGQNPMTKVLVALEMHSCNGLGLMEFTVPSLAQVLKMALDCTWTDPLVELQTLTRLAHFAFLARDFELALSCTQRALESDDKAKPNVRGSVLGCEMFGTAACIQGQSIMETLAGRKHLHLTAIKAFEKSARYGSEAGNPSLTLQAVRHFWHTSSPLMTSAKERDALKDSVICVIRALTEAETKQKTGPGKDASSFHLWPTMDVESRQVRDPRSPEAGNDEELVLKAGLYELLYKIYADKGDWESGLRLLDEAINTLPRTRHRLVLFKHRVLAKARLGRNFFMDMQKFKDESEDYVSYIWHRVAGACRDPRQQLACYLNAIDALKKPENDWQKVEYLLELAEWLHCRQYPLSDALSMLGWAEDILLHMKCGNTTEEVVDVKNPKLKMKPRMKSSQHKVSASEEPDSEVIKIGTERPSSACQSPEDLKNIRQLEALARTHTLMASLSGLGSPHHEQHSLMAYAFIMRIWQVSHSAAAAFMKTLHKNPLPAQNPQSASSRKEKGKKEASENITVKEKPKRKGAIETLPSNAEEWSSFDCPEELREAFKQDSSYQVINKSTIIKPTYSLYYLDLLVRELKSISYTHLTLPILHLAEVIAHDVVESKSLSDLYHLKISQICGDLKLYNAAGYQQKAAGNVFISDSELIRQAVNTAKEQNEGGHHFTTRQPLSGRKTVLTLNSDGKGLSGLSLPYLWLEKSDVLIQLGYFQPSRVLLSQAYKALQDIGDGESRMRCLHSLAELANCENNFGQAITLLLEAKDLERDAELLYKTSLTLTEAVLGEEKEGGERKACHILDSAINALKAMLKTERNQEPMYRFMIGKLSARKFSILLKDAQSLIQGSTFTSEVVTMLLDMCDQMSQVEADLLQSGHRESRAELLMEHSGILRILGRKEKDEERRHSYYLDACAMREQAVGILEQAVYNIHSSFEAGGMSLPLVRKLAEMKMDFAELLLEIIQLITKEERSREEEEKQKGPLRVMLEEYVRATPDYNSIEQEWKALSRSVSATALTQLTNALKLAGGCHDLKARCLYLTGKCLRLQSVRVDPLEPDMYWNEGYLDERKTEPSEDFETDRPEVDPQFTNQLQDQPAKTAATLKGRRALAELLLAQSTELLLQSINAAIDNNLMDVLSAASLEICSCWGHFDAVTAAAFLALHQSCSCSMMMEDVVLTATRNTSSSQFAALLHLLQYLRKKGDEGPLLKRVKEKLASTSKVWENLQVTMQHFSIFNELPPNFNILILQHSEDRSYLYGALLEKPIVITTQKGKLVQQRATQAKVARCSVDPQRFSSLLEKIELFKQDTVQRLCKEEDQQAFTKRKNVNPDPEMKETENERENKCKLQFNEIVEALETYLRPVLLQLDLLPTRQRSPPLSTTESVRAKSREKEEKPTTSPGSSSEVGDFTVVLADTFLQRFPLEALPVFKDDTLNSVSRDFSLQLLYNRMSQEQTEGGDGKRGLKSPREDKKKKNVKVAPINRVLPTNCIPVDTHRFKYIVDPYNEIKETEALRPASRMRELLAKYGQQFCAYWEGVSGARAPSLTEWENLMTDCSAFIFYGPEKFLSYVMLDTFLAMDLTDCRLMVLLDQMRSSQSFSRQSTIDVQKSKSQLLLERPVETALLLSAAGVRCVMLNQWHATADHNARRLDFLSEYLLTLGKTSGQTVHSQRKLQSDSDDGPLKGDNPEDNPELRVSPHPSLLPAGDPSLYNYMLYGLPNMVVM